MTEGMFAEAGELLGEIKELRLTVDGLTRTLDNWNSRKERVEKQNRTFLEKIKVRFENGYKYSPRNEKERLEKIRPYAQIFDENFHTVNIAMDPILLAEFLGLLMRQLREKEEQFQKLGDKQEVEL